jgi:cupin fold WbuC family metalloprotein
VLIGTEQVAELRREAGASPRRRARICLHPGPDDPVQEMLIALLPGSFIPPHRQVGKEKSYLVVEGALTVAFFDGERLDRAVRLGGSRPFLTRFSASPWHTVLACAGPVVYLETIAGPFRAEGTDFAPWAPANDDPAGVAWLAELQRQVEQEG